MIPSVIVLTTLNGDNIRMEFDAKTTNYKPNMVDIANAARLKFLENESDVKLLYGMLSDGKYQQAVKFVSFHSDNKLEVAKSWLSIFLCVTLGSHLIVNSFEENKAIFAFMKPFINGVNGFILTDYQILYLANLSFPDRSFNIVLD